jgi:1-acyl-sn-glycerol-3-phosphate acyltransferase
VVVVFPEGTRVDPADALGTPHHGAGRLAIATGAPIVPVAIAGTADLLAGPLPKPRRVWVSFLAPVDPHGAASDDPVAELIDREVWPAVMAEYGRLSAGPGIAAAGLAAIGLGGGLLARRSERSRPRLLGVVEPRRLRRARGRRRRIRALPRLPRR